MSRLFFIAASTALLLSLGLAGCASRNTQVGQHATPAAAYVQAQGQPTAPSPAAPPAPPAPVERPIAAGQLSYLLQPGDVVDVKFYYNNELNEQLIIPPDGNVALQLIGELQAQGLSTRQLSQLIRERYAPVLRKPEATVILRKYAQPRIFVAGEVLAPGAHQLESGSLSAFQAIVQSGGFKHSAERRNVIVLRNSGSGQPVFIKLDMQAHLEQTAIADLPLRPYDIVFVPQRQVAEVAEFFDEYINKILPIYKNLGFYFTYDVRRDSQVQIQPGGSQ